MIAISKDRVSNPGEPFVSKRFSKDTLRIHFAGVFQDSGKSLLRCRSVEADLRSYSTNRHHSINYTQNDEQIIHDLINQTALMTVDNPNRLSNRHYLSSAAHPNCIHGYLPPADVHAVETRFSIPLQVLSIPEPLGNDGHFHSCTSMHRSGV